MHIIQEGDLERFVEELRQQHPISLPVYMLARNHLLRNQFAWPGIQFVVDQFPGHSACVVRPDVTETTSEDNNRPPRSAHTAYTVVAKDAESLKGLLSESGVVDWTTPTTFGPTSVELLKTVHEVGEQYGNFTALSDWNKAIGILFMPGKINCGPSVPDGFTIRPLDRSDVFEVNATWASGGSAETLRNLLYLYDHGFPTMGAFTADNKLVGFEMCSSEMCLVAAYVKPEYRNKKLFHLISFALCEAIFETGQEVTCAFVSENNIASQSSLFRLGGEHGNWAICWTLFVPKHWDKLDDPLLCWFNVKNALQA